MDRWTKEEEEKLIKLYEIYKIKDLSLFFDKTPGAIKTKIIRLRSKGLISTKEENITDDEIKYVKDNWNKMSISDIARNINVNRLAIKKIASDLGLPPKKVQLKWTEERLEELRIDAKTMTLDDLAKKYKTTKAGISSTAHKYNIKLLDGKVKWTEEEVEFLRKNGPKKTSKELSIILGKTEQSICRKADLENISIRKDKRTWTKEDEIMLKDLSSKNMTVLQISKKMEKTDTMIISYLKKYGFNIILDEEIPWTPEDDEKLINLSKNKSLSDIVIELNRSTVSIKNRAKELNLNVTNLRRWTKDEIELLKKYVSEDKSIEEIAKLLNREQTAVILRIQREKIDHSFGNKKFWTKEEEDLLCDLWGKKSINQIATKLKRSASSINNKAYQLGLGNIVDYFFDGILLTDLSRIFNISIHDISILWVSLGLKVKERNITNNKSYNYVKIDDLMTFLENNQNLFDSRLLEENIFGLEPDWLVEKRKRDSTLTDDFYKNRKKTKVFSLRKD